MKTSIKCSLLFLLLNTSLYHAPLFALANPASVNCVEQGNKLILIENTGICIFPDGTYCEEWALYRGNCAAGTNSFPGGKFKKSMQDKYCLTSDKPPLVTMCDDDGSTSKE